MLRSTWFLGLLLLVLVPLASAQEAVSLLTGTEPTYGWTFTNGPEFPGAVGSLRIDTADRNCLRLDGDFSKGGNYIAATRNLANVDVTDISFDLKAPATDRLTIRVGDASGQCHQIVLKISQSATWQTIRFPLASYLANKGNSAAAEAVARYESWGGAKDGLWHGPCKYISVLVGPGSQGRDKPVFLSLADMKLSVKESAGVIKKTVRLDDWADGEIDWNFNNGQEFPGATGKLEFAKDALEAGQGALKLSGDFTKGGAYVSAEKSLDNLNVVAIHFKVKSDNVTGYSIRLGDSTGQCHQAKGFKIQADGKWHDVTLLPSQIAGGEHWSGANDGKWHGPAKYITFILGKNPAALNPVVYLADVSADVEMEAVVQAASFKAGFEGDETLPAGWNSQGKVSIDKSEAFKGQASLALQRTKENLETPTSVSSAPFTVKEGLWEIAVAGKADIYSPDNSYQGKVELVLLDAAGKTLDNVELGIFTANKWQLLKKRLDIPRGVAAARFNILLNKTYGKFSVDELSASYVSASARANASVSAIKFSSQVLGNLFKPDEKVQLDIAVECGKALPESAQQIVCVLKDYWGAEFSEPIKLKLEKAGKNKQGKRLYKATLDLSSQKLEEGKYYEVHGAVTEPDLAEPYVDKSTFAILPEAVTKQYKPFDIPFTSRDWDNRIKEYFFLSDRLGIRVCGIWSGWDAKPPYKPYAPGIEWCKQLGMGAVLGTPGNAIEYHLGNYKDYTETSLREGAKNLVNAYKDVVPFVVSLGNEPHAATDERAQEMVAAYKAMYEGFKQADPNLTVVGTSCGSEEIYFKNGFYKYLDVFDFHAYDDANSIKPTFVEYKEKLFPKYNCAKPIWSTELGLNCQGMTRRVVTIDLIKKFAIFFARGGTNMSWFDLLYPDPDGKRVGTNSEAFDVFNTKYSLYCPKLDAIAYYNMVNGICIKKFVAEKEYTGQIPAVLFRDTNGQCLLVIWKEKGRQDAYLPLPGVNQVKLIRIDGSSAQLNAQGKGLTLSLAEEPLLLLFASNTLQLAPNLLPPQFTVSGPIDPVIKGGAGRLSIKCSGVSPDEISLVTPPFWTVRKSGVSGDVVSFDLSAPEHTTAREGRAIAQLKNGAGELYLSLPIAGRLSVEFLPVAYQQSAAGMRFTITNNSPDKQELTWKVSIPQEVPMAAGTYKPEAPVDFTPAFVGPSEGKLVLDGRASRQQTVLASNFNPLNLYNAKLEVTDSTGKTITLERPFGGFAAVARAASPVKFDGKMGDPAWQSAPVLNLDQERQFFKLSKEAQWKGPSDLSGKMRFLWDDKYLYLGMEVTDDVFFNNNADSEIWRGDGLQIILDPCRETTEKPGRYDYTFARGTKGPQAWCYFSADSSAPLGEAKDIIMKVTPTGQQGGMIYEIAIPWTRLAPLKPAVGRDIGLGLIINEDDGPGRASFMAWFGCAHSKQLGLNGDLILTDQK